MPPRSNWNRPRPPPPFCTALGSQPLSALAPAATVRMKSGSLASSGGALLLIRSLSQPGTLPTPLTAPVRLGAPVVGVATGSGAGGGGRLEANCCMSAPARSAAPMALPMGSPAPGCSPEANCCMSAPERTAAPIADPIQSVRPLPLAGGAEGAEIGPCAPAEGASGRTGAGVGGAGCATGSGAGAGSGSGAGGAGAGGGSGAGCTGGAATGSGAGAGSGAEGAGGGGVSGGGASVCAAPPNSD